MFAGQPDERHVLPCQKTRCLFRFTQLHAEFRLMTTGDRIPGSICCSGNNRVPVVLNSQRDGMTFEIRNVLTARIFAAPLVALILIAGCSSPVAMRKENDLSTRSANAHRSVFRAQDAQLGTVGDGARKSRRERGPVEPAIWRNDPSAGPPVRRIEMTRYAPAGSGPLTRTPVPAHVVSQTISQTSEPITLPGAVTPTNTVPMVSPSSAGSMPQSSLASPLTPAPAPANAPPQQVFLPLTLREALEAALMDSSVIRTLEGRVNVAMITPADVEIADWNVLAEQGQFQPRLSGNYDATRVDQPPNAFFGPGISANTRRDVVDAGVSLNQPLKTGGLVSVGIEPATAYLYFPDGVGPGQFNPLYSTDYVLRVNQPVLRGAGSNVSLAPIRIAQTQANASRHDLEEVLNSQIRSVTEGYWRLYAAHLQVQAVRSVLPLAEESVRIETLRMKADRSILADVARARFQLDGFRRTETTMQATVRKRVLQLRQLMGGQPMVDPLLLPSEPPQEISPPGDTASLIQTAMQTRPALNALRERISEKQQILLVARNNVFPNVDVRGEYRMNGLAERLDDSFNQAASSDYTDFTLGFGVDVPIGNKTARSRRRMAELNVARDQMRLNALEQNVAFEVTELVSDLEAAWQRLQIAKRQTTETQEWLRVSRIRYTQPPAGSSSEDWLLLALTDLQSAMRSYVDSITDLSEAVADYNTLLAELQQAQGIAVYQWQQAEAVNVPMVGGHAGLTGDYRTNPAATLQRFSTPGSTPPMGETTANPGWSAGHSFGQTAP